MEYMLGMVLYSAYIDVANTKIINTHDGVYIRIDDVS